MTIVNHNTTAHSGLLVTGSGDRIDIDVELVGGRTLRMSSAGEELGTWPIDDCHIESDETRPGSFRIIVDGDDARFTPVDPVGFRSLVALVTGTEPDWTPVAHEPRPVATPESVSPADPDDAVAFLFGSAPLPVPEPDSDDQRGTDTVEAVGPTPLPGTDVTDQTLPFDLTEDDLYDADDHLSVAAVEPIVDEPLDEVEPIVDEAFDEVEPLEGVEPFDETGPFLGDLETDGDVIASVEPVSDAPERDLRSRFGGSSLDKLSAAIGAVNAQKRTGSVVDDEEDYVIGPNTVADEVLSSQRTLRDHQLKDAKRGKRLKIAGIVTGTAAVIALLTLLAPGAISFVQNYQGGAEPPPPLEVSATTVPPTPSTVGESVVDLDGDTTPIPAEAAAPGTLFDRPAPEFVARWDATGGTIDEVLRFDSYPIVGPFEERFTPYLSATGVVEPAGTLGSFSLVIDPSGPAQYDRIALQALGVAIATFDPDRSPEGRATLLAQLGLNVRQPLLAGIDGTLTIEELAYSLVYDDTTTLLTLTVAPAN